MLQYFRLNDPYRLLGVLVIMTVLSLPLFIDSAPITYPELKSIIVGEKINQGTSLYIGLLDPTAPLTGIFNAALDMVFGRSILARHIITYLFIFSQAAFLGTVFIYKKAFAESTYIPSLIFAVLFFFSFDTLSLHADVLASGFLLLALNNLFRQIEFREPGDPSIFNLGIYISLASLCSFSFIIYLLAAVVILLVFTRSPLRSYLLLIFGFLLPHLLLMSVYYLNDGVSELWNYFYVPNLGFAGDRYIDSGSLWLLAAVPLFFLVVSLVMLNRDARFTKYQSQLVQLMFFWMIFSVLQILYNKELRPQSFITLIPSFSFYIAHFLLLIRRRKFAELSFWILFISVISIAYVARYNKIAPIHYDSLIVQADEKTSSITNKKILVLGDDLRPYKNNMLGSGFFNWHLAKEIFGQPDYYENIILVNESFSKDLPEIIVDPSNVLPGIFKRIPRIKDRYVTAGDGLYRLK